MTGRCHAGLAVAIPLSAIVAMAAMAIKSALNAALGTDVGLLPAMAAVVVAAWLGGFIPGLVATAVSMLLEGSVFMVPAGQLEVALASDRVRLLLFGLVGLLMSWLGWLRVRAQEDAHRALADAEQERARLSDGERAALRRAEAAQQSLDLLAETGRVLGQGLDYEVTLRRLAGIALPLLGDLGIVDVLEPEGVRRFVASTADGGRGGRRCPRAPPRRAGVRGPDRQRPPFRGGRCLCHRREDAPQVDAEPG